MILHDLKIQGIDLLPGPGVGANSTHPSNRDSKSHAFRVRLTHMGPVKVSHAVRHLNLTPMDYVERRISRFCNISGSTRPRKIVHLSKFARFQKECIQFVSKLISKIIFINYLREDLQTTKLVQWLK